MHTEGDFGQGGEYVFVGFGSRRTPSLGVASNRPEDKEKREEALDHNPDDQAPLQD